MPLLGIFSKKSSKTFVSATDVGHGSSNGSLVEEDYVSVVSPNSQQPPSSTKLGLPLWRRRGQDRQTSHLGPQNAVLEPPPRHSSLFQNYQLDDSVSYRSAQSRPGKDERPSPPPQPNQDARSETLTASSKKSLFSWKSSKERSKSPSTKSSPENSSFNLKSFRHVLPESSSLLSSSSGLPPIPAPTPTKTMPPSPASFQVTSRRPRGDSASNSASPRLPPIDTSQKMAAGAFLQAARRSSTSLSLDSPVLPTRGSLDDRPPPSLLPPSSGKNATSPTVESPSRSEFSSHMPASVPSRAYSPISQPNRVKSPEISAASSRKNASKPAPRKGSNAFGMSSSSSSSEEEEEEEDSTDAGARLARQTTIKPRTTGLPPLSHRVREQIDRATPNSTSPPRAQSWADVYTPNLRQRASQSVGALSPSANDARASVAIAETARTTNHQRLPPKAASTTSHTSMRVASFAAKRGQGSDTSESEELATDSEEDAPLSSLVLPRRPGTSMSTHSLPGRSRKPLVDLGSPSTMADGLPRISPMARDEQRTRHQPRTSSDSTTQGVTRRSEGLNVSPSLRPSKVPSSSRSSQVSESRVSLYNGRDTSPSSQSSRALQQGRLDTRSPPSSRTNLSPHILPPMRPFATRESPASSTAGSSSGKAPLTPQDGSDVTRGSDLGRNTLGPAGRGGRGHGRKASVTFEDEQESVTKKGKAKEKGNDEAARLRDRRRTEARAAIELGNVVNGPLPVDDDDMASAFQPNMQAGGWPQLGMPFPVPPVPPMYNMGMNMSASMPSPGPFGFGVPPPVADPAYLFAHQQAMAIAKQTFQYTVAQQALAAADEEWERSSNAGAQWRASQWGGSPYSYGMPSVGMGMNMRSSVMFPSAPRSMYAGSAGGWGANSDVAWGGARSVYGEPFGPARQPVTPQGGPSQNRTPRPRTKTAPSGTAPAVGVGRMPVPPSSYRGIKR